MVGVVPRPGLSLLPPFFSADGVLQERKPLVEGNSAPWARHKLRLECVLSSLFSYSGKFQHMQNEKEWWSKPQLQH